MTTLLVAGGQRCTAACYNATGPACDCVCEGRCHGVGWARAVELAPDLVAAGQPGAVVALGLPLREVDWDAELTDDKLRAALSAEELALLLIDAAATVDLGAREAERLGRDTQAAELDRLRDELVAEAFPAAVPAEEGPMPAKVDLRAPYSAAEWAVIEAALKAERERRTKRGEPFTQADQVSVIHEAVRPMREGALTAEAR